MCFVHKVYFHAFNTLRFLNIFLLIALNYVVLIVRVLYVWNGSVF